MSAAPQSSKEPYGLLPPTEQDGVQMLASADTCDTDATPRSELALPAVHLRTPGGTAIETVQSVNKGTDYFTLPTRADIIQQSHSREHPQALPLAPVEPSAGPDESSIVPGLAERQVEAEREVEHLNVESGTRPNPHAVLSNLSIESGDSAITVTPIRPAVRSGILQQQHHHPVYPDQSYAALQEQKYPPPHIPPLYRVRTSHPSHIHTFTSAFASTHQSGSRTAASSPALTSNHGLFNAYAALEQREIESAENLGTYASPFLHFTHRQAPKETHVADVDVDTVSGRKVINHYEIIDELGRGTHGKVKLGRDLNTKDTCVAIKIVERYSKRRKLGKLGQAEDKVKKEVAILKKARHPNVVALLEVIDDPSRKKVYIVLEWVANGEINWRARTPIKEIAILEARRYERERSGFEGPDAEAEDQALLTEVQHRLAKKARHELRKFRRGVRDAPNTTAAFSYEMVGDHDSDEDDDRSSRVSTTTTGSAPQRPLPLEGRLPSRPETPLVSADSPITPASDSADFLPLTPDVDPLPSTELGLQMGLLHTGLEGTMYGAYDHSLGDSARLSTTTGDTRTAESLAKLVNEILDSELNRELEYVPVMTIQQARVAFRDTLLGLQYLHSQGIVHRDIKPPNLLSTKDHRVKISDFGVSHLGKPIHEGDVPEDVSEHEAQELDEAKELAKTVGTPAFYAPELCITEATNDGSLPVTKAIDVWALGITLFCMIFARTPFVDSEYVVMRQIADEEVYIPHKRLVPVVLKSPSHPTSHNRSLQHNLSGRRLHGNLLYEDLDDSLYDLLKRLLIKDPRRRITLEEVRHHPWVSMDLSDKAQWLEETDPARSTQSQKIEVSREDVNTAVVPLQFLDRVRSGIKKVGERLGLSGKSTARPRTSSNASHGGTASPSVSANSSSSNISQDVRRQSLRGDESIFSALQRSRETEHPLSKSVAASPDLDRRDRYFDAISVASSGDRDTTKISRNATTRPLPERSKTIVSTAESVRTLKQADINGHSRQSPPPSPGLPSTPIALESPGGNGLSAIFGSGSARRVLRTLRERSSAQSSLLRTTPLQERASISSLVAHGEPSLAVSTTSAEGHVNLPEALQDPSRTQPDLMSSQNSPSVSRPHSEATSPPDHLQPNLTAEESMTRSSSASSFQADHHYQLHHATDWHHPRDRSSSRSGVQSDSEAWQRGAEEQVRKLKREAEEVAARPLSSNAILTRSCPPSPDDMNMFHSDDVAPTSYATRRDIGPLPNDAAAAPAIISSSSEFGSAVSMSVSDPSVPSAISENSSLQPLDIAFKATNTAPTTEVSDSTLQSPSEEFDSGDEGYRPDLGSSFNSDEDADDDEDSSDSDDGLVMTRRRSKQGQSILSANRRSLHGCDSGEDRHRLSTSVRSKKSSRSGSNNTMKKVHTRDSDDGGHRRSLDIRED